MVSRQATLSKQLFQKAKNKVLILAGLQYENLGVLTLKTWRQRYRAYLGNIVRYYKGQTDTPFSSPPEGGGLQTEVK